MDCLRVTLWSALLLVGFSIPALGDWTGWRGDGTGVARVNNAPTHWSETENIRWRTRIPGNGHSSPIISGDSVFLTTAIDGVGRSKNARHVSVTAFAALLAGLIGFSFGKRFFIKPIDRCKASDMSGNSDEAPKSKIALWGRICCILTVLFFAFGGGYLAHIAARPDHETLRIVISLDRKLGEIRWMTECGSGPLLGSTALTSAASPTPVTDGQNVFAHFGNAGTYCLDFEGRIRWSNHDSVPATHYKAGSSPVLWKELLILSHDTDTESYSVALEASTGKRRWIAERKRPSNGRRHRVDAYSTPIVVCINDRPLLIHDSYRQLCAYDPRDGHLIWSVDHGAEQVVTSPVVSESIIAFSGECNHPIHFSAVDIGSASETGPEELLWTTNKQVPVVSSPVTYEGFLFAISKTGIATCRKLDSGEMVWRERLPGTYYASMVIADGSVYFANLDGVTTVMSADIEPRIISTNTLTEPIYSSFAFSDGELFIRSESHLYCISTGNQD